MKEFDLPHDSHVAFATLFWVMIINIVATGFLAASPFATSMSTVTSVGALLVAIYLVSQSRRWLIILVLTSVPAIVNNSLVSFLGIPQLESINNVLFVLSHISVTVFLVLTLIYARHANLSTIYGAMCAYLMMGKSWTYVYLAIEAWQPGSFIFSDELRILGELNYHQLIAEMEYFSYVTLTTLGYGDITPILPAARSVTILEAILGQLYLTIVLARLVGLYLQERTMKAAPNN